MSEEPTDPIEHGKPKQPSSDTRHPTKDPEASQFKSSKDEMGMISKLTRPIYDEESEDDMGIKKTFRLISQATVHHPDVDSLNKQKQQE